jgi:hypothetical protein
MQFFHTWTKLDLQTMCPSTRAELAMYLFGVSCKLQALVYLLLRHLIDRNEKVIIWANEPQTIWLCELALLVLEIGYVAIHAGVKISQRVQAELSFNHSPEVMVMVCSSRSCQESMNLQEGGHVCIIMDVIDATSETQVIGRQHRIGQKHPVLAYNIVTDESHDQVMAASYHSRYRDTILANTIITPAHAQEIYDHLSEDERLRLDAQSADDPDAGSPPDIAVRFLREAYADAVIRELRGHRTTRTGLWSTPYEFTEKNTMPEEVLYRITLGGAVAKEVAHQLRALEEKEGLPTDARRGLPKITHDRLEDHLATDTVHTLGHNIMSRPVPEPRKITTAEGATYLARAATDLALRREYQANDISVLGE